MGKVKFMQPIEFVCDIVPLLITIIDGFLRIKCPGKRCGLVRHLRFVGLGWMTSCWAWRPGDDAGPAAKWWKSFPSAGVSITLPSLLHSTTATIKTATRVNKAILARTTAECILVSLLKFMHCLEQHLFPSFLGDFFRLGNPPPIQLRDAARRRPYIMNLKSW